MDISSIDTEGDTERRQFLAFGSLLLCGTAGCLRLSNGGTTSTSTPSGRAQSETRSDSPEPTSYPPLELELAAELEFSGTNSSPGTKFAAVDDSRIAAVGGKAVKIVNIDRLTVEKSVPIPNVSNFGSHGIISHGGSVYAAVGGSSNAQVIKIAPESGEMWRFEEDAFGPNVLRKIGGPVTTESVVAVTVATTDNREGESDTRIYLLDAESGELIVSPEATPGEEDSLYTTGIAAGTGFVVLSGHDGYYFYDVAAREYVGNTRGYGGEEPVVHDGVFYTGKAAYDVSTREQQWENSGGPASVGTTLTDDSMYYGTPVSGVSLEDGTLRWTHDPDGTVRGIATAGDGDVWAGTDRNTEPGFLYRIDAEDGSVLGASELPRAGDSPISTPFGLIRHGDRLFVGSSNSLVAYDVDSSA
jgi:hypothetical protein